MGYDRDSKGSLTSGIPANVAALLAALQCKDASPEPLELLTDTEWQELLSFCDLSHLTLVVARLKNGRFPPWVVERLKKNISDNELRFDRVRATYREVALAFQTAHVKHIVLKGFTHYPDYVSHPSLRMQSNIDLYCPPEFIDRAIEALLTLGYSAEGTQDYSRAGHLPTMVRAGDWKWRGNTFDPEMPLPIDVHVGMWNEHTTRLALPGVEGFWKRRVLRSVDGIEFPALNSVDNIGYVALHILWNLLSDDCIIHHVYELARFLDIHARDDEFWQSWGSTHDSKMRSLQAIAFYLANAWFNCDLSPAVRDEIAALSTPVEDWLDRFAFSPLTCMFNENKDRMWLHLSLLDSAGQKRHLLRRTLFPRRAPAWESSNLNLNNRQVTKNAMRSHTLRYLVYCVSRIVDFSRVTPLTLWRGRSWWLRDRQLGRQFWTFLCASFFLTWAFRPTSFSLTCF